MAQAHKYYQSLRVLGTNGLLSKVYARLQNDCATANAMTKKGPFLWTEVGDKAFKVLKVMMTRTPVSVMSYSSKEFEVHTDASDIGIGIVLVQRGRPLAYLSKVLGVKKVGWSVYFKEMLAIVEVVRVWRPYLMGRKFIIITDQQPLKHMLEQ